MELIKLMVVALAIGLLGPIGNAMLPELCKKVKSAISALLKR